MKRFVLWVSLTLWMCIAGAVGASATTYYVAANGSDSNNGTSKSTPWLHAPGMANCSGTCASTTPNAGDSFIFRGGDTWHHASGTPVGLPWNWKWSGASGSPIYIGVDKSWSAGSSWSRPVLTMDNPLSTSKPSSCAHPDDGITTVELGSQNYVTLDNFEFTGKCWSQGGGVTIHLNGTQVTISNNYFHGWTMAAGATDDHADMINGSSTPNGRYQLFTLNVFDGQDSSLGTTTGKATGFAIYNTGTEISWNIFRHVSNGMINRGTDVHDNLFEFLYDPSQSGCSGCTHGNVFESNGAGSGPFYYYNNIVRHTNEGVGVWAESVAANMYFFNNVTFDNVNGTNCYMVDGQGSGPAVQVYFYNNTDVNDGTGSTCIFRSINNGDGQAFNGTINFANNHYINYSGGLSSTYTSGTSTTKIVDNGNHVFQTGADASSQGYAIGNNFAPTSSADATVGAGADMSSFCNAVGSDTASTACKSGMGGVTYDTSNHTANPITSVVARNSSTWDAGAYEFGAASTSKPNPPQGLQATVQ